MTCRPAGYRVKAVLPAADKERHLIARDWRIQDIQTHADHYGVDYRNDGGSH